jgi:hypothetical protein
MIYVAIDRESLVVMPVRKCWRMLDCEGQTFSHRGQSTISSSSFQVTLKCRGPLRAGEGGETVVQSSALPVIFVHVTFEASMHRSCTDFTLLQYRKSGLELHRFPAWSAVVTPVREAIGSDETSSTLS